MVIVLKCKLAAESVMASLFSDGTKQTKHKESNGFKERPCSNGVEDVSTRIHLHVSWIHFCQGRSEDLLFAGQI